MTGKLYTLTEMKQIVQYLTEHKAYGEIRGRKMWMDFANSQLTDRTWQSLKETFLKRILPDIHNPYYKLTREQIGSFRQGYDVETKSKSKLEIRTASDCSSNSGDNHEVKEKPSTSKTSAEKKTGEDIKCSKIQTRNKSSTDTLVLENVYETPEDIQRELESPSWCDKEETTTKSLRDYITYSEPLTPAIQDVLDDFATDEEVDEISKIPSVVPVAAVPDKNPQEHNKNQTISDLDSQSILENKIVETEQLNKEALMIENHQELDKSEHSSKKSLKLNKSVKKTLENNNIGNKNDSDNVSENTPSVNEDVEDIRNTNEASLNDTYCPASDNNNKLPNSAAASEEKLKGFEINEKAAENCSNVSFTTADSVLPNNQEALNPNSVKNPLNEGSSAEFQESTKTGNNAVKRITRKKSNTHVTTKPKKKLWKAEQLPVPEQVTEDQVMEEDTVEIIACGKETNSNIVNSKEDLHNPVEFQQEKSSDIQKSNNNDETHDVINTPENQIKSKKDTSQNQDEPKENNLQEAGPSTTIMKNIHISAETNPCLKSVSLFAEQFSQSKYSDSESNDEEITTHDKAEAKSIVDDIIQVVEEDKTEEIENVIGKTGKSDNKIGNSNEEIKTSEVNLVKKLEEKGKNTAFNHINDVLVLASHSDSSENEAPIIQKKETKSVCDKFQKDRVLANMFGFSSGAVSRKRSLSYRNNCRRYLNGKRRKSHNHIDCNRESSDYTSCSSSNEDMSPRDRAHSRKCMKPDSLKVFTLPGDGGLFVASKTHLYPVISKGRNINNFLNWPESDEEDEKKTYWKLKYYEEKIRADELARLLKESKEQPPRDGAQSPILPVKQSRRSVSRSSDRNEQKESRGNDTCKEEISLQHTDKKQEPHKQDKTVKIKFTRDNEIELECQLSNVDPVLEKMAQMYFKNTEARSDTKPTAQPVPRQESPITIVSTPVDPEIHEKINKMESEIFKEIEEIDKSNESSTLDANVTKRKRGRQKQTLSSDGLEDNSKTGATPRDKGGRYTIRTRSMSLVADAESGGSAASKRRARAPKRIISETTNIEEPKVEVKRKRSNKSISSKKNKAEDIVIPEDDSQVLYKLRKSSRLSLSSTSANETKNKKTSKSYVTKKPSIYCPNDDSSRNSESAQGYQDSDISPALIRLKRRRKLSLSSLLYKGRQQSRRKMRRRSDPYLGDDDSCEAKPSNNMPLMARHDRQSSVDTDVYTSDSYRLLLPKPRTSLRQLDKIDEVYSATNEFPAENTNNFKPLSPVSLNEILTLNGNNSEHKARESISSNVSLPLSPELSVVENISIGKDMLSSVEDHPTINETQANDSVIMNTENKYVLSSVDISLPLMEQDCDLRKRSRRQSISACDLNLPKNTISDTFLTKLGTVNIEGQTLSPSLDLRLKNLLLDSAKKLTEQVQTNNEQSKENYMEVDTVVSKKEKRTRVNKRCSTPRKKTDVKKSKLSNVEAVVEEECIESCSYGSRKSCPPAINIVDCTEETVGSDNNDELTNKPKGRKKKDVIKVKILRPRPKSIQKDKARSSSRISICTDSGINVTESGVFLHAGNDSVDLIHNHSDTCLQKHECVDDSIVFIEPASKSVISLNSTSKEIDNDSQCPCGRNSDESDRPEWFCNNAQDATSLRSVTKNTAKEVARTSGATIYHSPLNGSFNSLLTEDLSQETLAQSTPTSKWYLLSDEETTNTRFVDARSQASSNIESAGSNLNQIFTIVNAVPNLSTITENSRENDCKISMDTSNGDGNNLQSIFDLD